MRVIIQRVKQSSVKVNGITIGAIEKGLNILVGIAKDDSEDKLDWMVKKCLELRLFAADDHSGKWDKSVQEINGELLVISQFTLYGDCRKGRRPSFDQSAPPREAELLYDLFVQKLKIQSGLKVETGKFGAMMDVYIENDGPVTLILER
jgi:D-aminoacyl-tRNA deacylase